MASTITAHHQKTVDRMAEGLRVHASLNRGRVGPAILFVGQLLSLASLGFALWALSENLGVLELAIVALAVVLTAGFAVANFFVHSDRSHVLIARFVIKRMPDGARNVDWTFSDGRIEARNEVSAASFSWELVTKVVEVPSGFLICRGKYVYDWIPGEAFESPVDARLFATMAELHAKEFLLIGECRTDVASFEGASHA